MNSSFIDAGSGPENSNDDGLPLEREAAPEQPDAADEGGLECSLTADLVVMLSF
jgi:hypothetical protein